MKDTALWHIMSYAEKVSVFNSRCGSSYLPSAHFLTFKMTRRGIMVGYTRGTPYEVSQLCSYVLSAGKPFYYKGF